MNSAFRTTLKGIAIAAAFAPALAMAQDTKNQGYLVDQNSNVVMAIGAGVCVRDSDWTPARAAAAAACQQCTPDLCPKPPAPKPAPAPAAKPEAKPEAKPKPKIEPINVELKIELQGIPFNKTELTADNKKELDEFLATEVKPLNTVGAVIITGHTDRIGSEKYNKKLSEKRALNAKDYIVGKGIDQKLIFWEGKAAKQPIPVTKFCENKMKRKQLIECLAPNRRVTVEVVGTKLPPAPKPKP
jgi:OmpA-OmpF porin, OOP family